MKYNKLSIVRALKIAEKLDIDKKYRLSDIIFQKIIRKANEQPFELAEGLEYNDPQTIMDYFMGYAFDMYSRKKDISKRRLILELSKLVDEKTSEMTDENREKLSDLKEQVLDELTNQYYWNDLSEESESESGPIAEDPKKFIEKLSGPAQSAASKFDNIIPPSFIIALAAWESGWGKSKLASQYGNYFGIKQSPSSGAKSGVSMGTFEYYDGTKTKEQAEFAVFGDDAVSSMTALPNFLFKNPRYKKSLEFGLQYKNSNSKSDLYDMIDSVFAAGYSTDPNEPGNIKRLIEKYNLTQFDQV